MKFQDVHRHVQGIPLITLRNAEKLYDFIVKEKIKSVLELGIAHGTASCYIAAALDELEGGELVCVDLLEPEELFDPSPEELLARTNLSKLVKIVREKTGYNWFLHNEIKAQTEGNRCIPKYDLCIIDGPKQWTTDGAAFFMVDKLLKPGGWVIFDDYTWTHTAHMSNGRDVIDGFAQRSLSQDELNTAQIKEVFQLLVMQHPDYGNFKIHGEGDWAWAQKTASPLTEKQVTIEYNVTYKGLTARLAAALNKVFKVRKI